MGNTYFANIKNCTASIVVNGINKIDVDITFSNNNSGDYESEIFCEFGNARFYRYLRDTLPQTISFTIPVDWLIQIPDSVIGIGHIKVQSVNMDTAEVVHSETRNFTVYVPEEYKPNISNLSIQMYDFLNSPVDYAVYGITKPEINALVSSHTTSPLYKYHITGGGMDISGDLSDYGYGERQFIEFGELIQTFGNTYFTLTVEDKRGRSAKVKSDSFYVYPYTRPSIKSISAYRTDENGISKLDGGYIKFTVDASMTSIKNSNGEEVNTLKCYLQYKKISSIDYGHSIEIENNKPYIFEADKDDSFDLKCEVRDKYLITEAFWSVTGDNKDFNIVDGGGGAAIGTKAVKGYFDVAYKSRFQKKLSANEEITSNKGLVSKGTASKGDFLTFGEAERIETITHIVENENGSNYTVVDSWGDFNNCTNIGMYCIHYNEDVSPNNYYKVLNAPCYKAGTLRVYNATGNITEEYLMQEYVVYDGSEVYRRCLYKTSEKEDFGNWKCYPAQEDYIVEQGTSGIWTYRKWYSGIAECWGRYTANGINAAKNNYSGYYYSDIIEILLPCDFLSIEDYQVNGGSEDRVNFARDYGIYSGNNKVGLRICEHQSEATSVDISVYVSVKGRWK